MRSSTQIYVTHSIYAIGRPSRPQAAPASPFRRHRLPAPQWESFFKPRHQNSEKSASLRIRLSNLSKACVRSKKGFSVCCPLLRVVAEYRVLEKYKQKSKALTQVTSSGAIGIVRISAGRWGLLNLLARARWQL